MQKALITALSAVFLLQADSIHAGLCRSWSRGIVVGHLDATMLPEASGLSVSRKHADRLYHINDSGDGPFFYVTDTRGGATRRIRISGFEARGADVEDLSLGPCGLGKTCLFIADIGDNKRKRKTVRIIVVQERGVYGHAVEPACILTLAYPDGAHDAEAMAVDPNGDIYILTKELDLGKWTSFPAKLFKMEREKWEGCPVRTLMLLPSGEIDVPLLTGSGANPLGGAVTSMDISPDGPSFLVLTYEYALEFRIDPAGAGLKPPGRLLSGRDYRVIDIAPLSQQEAIAYLPGSRRFLYDTELVGARADIILVECLD